MPPLTYAAFHALFLAPPLVALGVATRWRSRPAESHVRPPAVVAVVAIALVYTIPWDNLLVERGVWWYGAGRVTAVLWHAPLEEYLFIAVQPLLAALWLHHVSPRYAGDDGAVVTRRDRLVGGGGGVLVCLVGIALLARPRTYYLGAILAWSGPVLALQWAVGWPYLVARRRTLAVAVAVPTAYLWVADWVAIRAGVWIVSEEFTVGLAPGGLPIEEAIFFLVTNVFVVQALLLYPWVIDRWRAA